ncbi:MAG: hypothetical protein QOE29_1291 [Gaiellaceae bacterium]|jgi:uncharacterized protein YqhQ|nr:hypothetical protein [Gaiellaceae bacterium]
MEEPIRLGGMALANGVLVHGPSSWAAAVRLDDGSLKVVAERKRLRANDVELPFLRGPLRLVEAFAVLPRLRARLPEARLPFQRPAVLAAMLGSAITVRGLRAARIRPLAQELLAGLAGIAPAALAMRGSDLAAYHGAEHVSIGTYEHGEERAKEHERCGGHLVGPLLLSSALANLAVRRAPEHLRSRLRFAAQLLSVGVATETFGWMTRHPEHPVARALSRPGHELQHRLSTREPSADQLEVAEAALAACLALEREAVAA